MASNNAPISYSAMASKGLPPKPPQQENQAPPIRKVVSSQPTSTGSRQQQQDHQRREPSPSHIPRTEHPEDNVYVLTILTDQAHHARMTALRTRYFPKRINKLAAHLTLFHALPGSKLESSVIPAIEDLILHTTPFKIHATEPFQLKKGIAIHISNPDGGRQGHAIHRELQNRWRNERFLSDQDAGGCRLHYTIMNKVDDEDGVGRAYEEVVKSFEGDVGTAEGLALWRYDRGFWRADRRFLFEKK
jgi:hypothetical protein